MGNEWTDERKAAASERMKKINAAKKSVDAKDRIRIGAGAKRDILSLPDKEDGYTYRVVNDVGSRIDNLTDRGYEMVEDAQLGTSHVDGNNSTDGVVSRDVGKGTTAYLMRQRDEHYKEDQSDKQREVDESEAAFRRKKTNANESTDGTYGEVKIG